MQKACIVIPCYNEAQRLDFSAFQKFMSISPDVDFLFSNDGSTDNTGALLAQFAQKHPDRIFVLTLSENSGKAEAVRCGILEACKKTKYSYVGFWDADLATPLEEVDRFLNKMKERAKLIAIGSRWKRLGATVERRASRHYLGRVFSTFSSIILGLPVYDTQCGAKIFHSTLQPIFEEKFITRWLFDIEIIARYRNKFGMTNALGHITEVPVNTWLEKGGSKLKMKHMLKVPLELLRIHFKYN